MCVCASSSALCDSAVPPGAPFERTALKIGLLPVLALRFDVLNFVGPPLPYYPYRGLSSNPYG